MKAQYTKISNNFEILLKSRLGVVKKHLETPQRKFRRKKFVKKIVKTCGEPITRLELGYFTLHPNPNERTDRVVRH